MPDQRRQRRSVVVPPRRRRRSALRRVFYSLILLAGCGALLVFGAGLYGYKKFAEAGPLAADTVFQIERGGGLLGIAAELEKGGVISDANIFAAAAKLTGSANRLKPGEYQFRQAMSMREVMALLVSGKFITYKLTVPEGWTTAQALDRVRENEVLTGDITLTPAEGQIMPDTYVFQRGETRDHIVKGMMNASQKLMDELWPQRAADAPVATPAEALILASIVEKETGVPDERPRVAAVFSNRLKQNMRLQSDPTIIYGITGGKTKLDRALTKQDIAEVTPYNTYRINGLPPGPIANPGRAAIAATLAPARTNDLYFVADGSGGHVFAATLEEHRANVKKWREIEKQRNQDGGEVPVMDEGGAGASNDTAATTPESAPASQTETSSEQSGDNKGLPAGAEIETPEQGADTSPEAQVENEPGQADGTTQAAVPPPIPRPRPDGMGPPAAPAEAAAPATPAEPDEPTTVANAALDLKPGSVIKGAKRLIPIPAPKPH